MTGFYRPGQRDDQRMRRFMSISGAGIAASATPYIDSLAVAPVSVLSLRKMVSTATLSIRVRRSSDNVEQDIGFSGSGLDTASLATFIGSNSGYVTKFYDQTANALHAVQATAANQPRIVNAGTYDGKLVFDGTSDSLKITALTQGAAQAAIYAKLKQSYAATYKILAELSIEGSSNAGAFNWYLNNTTTDHVLTAGSTGGARSDTFAAPAMSALTQCTALYDRSLTGLSEVKLWVAGAAQTGASGTTTEQTGTFITNDLYIGARAGTSLFADMWLETMVFYNADTASIRSSIEAIVA